ncbi:copper resistance CopC family protein [Demequina flava]|uniref:copper resistance CopC family protein n=1 Tax=Demequina flava TaxID=1095025 RepID=UPI000782CAA0|nr:copper resistance CopC family protein [Demequina flava]
MPAVISAPARALVALVAAAALTVGLGTVVSAHTELRSSDPAADSTVDVLETVTLDFSSDILDIGSELALVDAEGDTHELEPTYPSSTAVSADVNVDLPAGDTVLQFRIVAEDGHPIEGEIPFTFAPADGESGEADAVVTSESISPEVSASPEASASPMADEGLIATAPTASPSPGEAPADDSEGASHPWIWIVVSVAVMGTAAAALIAQSRRK